MGHTRLGDIPKTQQWKAVLAYLSNPPETAFDVPRVAAETMAATAAGLDKALRDDGLTYSFFLLTQIALASKGQNLQERLAHLGIQIPADAGPGDLSLAVQDLLDQRKHTRKHNTDFSEIAERALTETLISATAVQSGSLFGAESEQLQKRLRSFSSTRGFGELGRDFFSKFLARFLNFYLSRATAHRLGRGRIQNTEQLSAFNEALRLHCKQRAEIVRSFCGEWFSKTEFKHGIDPQNSKRFIAIALRKLKAELKRGDIGI